MKHLLFPLQDIQKQDVNKIVSSACTDIGWIFSVRGLSNHDARVLFNIRLFRRLISLQHIQGKQQTHLCIPKNDPIEDKNLFFDMIQKLDIHIRPNLHIYDGME